MLRLPLLPVYISFTSSSTIHLYTSFVLPNPPPWKFSFGLYDNDSSVALDVDLECPIHLLSSRCFCRVRDKTSGKKARGEFLVRKWLASSSLVKFQRRRVLFCVIVSGDKAPDI